jgi:hypothetical protein
MSLPASSIGSTSGLPVSSTTGVPVVNQALAPEWVRHGSQATQRAYQTALAFEQTLVEQLARSLTATSGLTGEPSGEGGLGGGSGLGGEGDAGGEAQSGELSSMLPQALAAGVMNGGGLGLAAQLTRGLHGAQATGVQATGAPTTDAPTTDATGGTDGRVTGGDGS